MYYQYIVLNTGRKWCITYQYIVPNTNRKWCIIKHQVPNTNRIWCIIKIKFPIYFTNLNTTLPFTTNFFTMFSWPRCYRVRFTLIRFSQLLPNLEYGVLKPRNQHSQNFFLKWIIISKMVYKFNLKWDNLKDVTPNQYIMLGTLMDRIILKVPNLFESLQTNLNLVWSDLTSS